MVTVLDELVDMDPRIEARRREVAHAGYRRKRRWWILALVLAVAALGGWYWASANVLDAEQEPTAPVVRHPVAAIAATDGSPLGVDSEGWVLGPPAEGEVLVPIGGLGQVVQGQQLPPASAGLLEVAVAMPPELLGRVTAIVPDGQGGILLGLHPSGEALFGPAEEIHAKLRSLGTIFDQVVDNCLATVDVRVAEQVAVRRDPTCTAVPTSGGETGSGSSGGAASGTASPSDT